ncbi:unnamed protein product [Durusdinium trenchii]|uniref:Zeta toxin domain-containing protein n=1 Tax=Durusdinium trenchii TaxID=1381693 RepID=A0ABP0RPW4_9DINO
MDLSALRCLRSTLRCGPGIRWDFETQTAQPGRRWSKAPAWLATELVKDMSPEELKEIREVARMDCVSSSEAPKILCLIGPSAAGKSKMMPLAAEYFELDLKNFAEVDGDQMRGCHHAWKKYVVEEQEHGYFDAYDIYITNKHNKGLKVKFLKELLQAKKNIIYGDTHVTDEDFELMKAQGYAIYTFGMLISCADSDCRQKNRAEANGRWAGTAQKKWLATMEDVLSMCRKADKAVAFDNTELLTPRRVYARGLNCPDQDELQETFDKLRADISWKLPPREGHAWCECLSLEGVYRKDDGGAVEITVQDPTREVSEVLLRPPELEHCCFSVRTCALHAFSEDPDFVGDELGRLDVTSQVLRWRDGRRWTLEAKLPTVGICRAVREDRALLEALRQPDGSLLDFCTAPFRDLNEEEWAGALQACNVAAQTLVPAEGSPKALLVMAPSAGGKTTVVSQLCSTFGLEQDRAARADGALFRDVHRQYRLLCENGVANDGLWYNAWPAAKAVVQEAKKEVFRRAMVQKQELIVSDTGSEVKGLKALIQELQCGGYQVSLLGIYADPSAILARGIAREIHEGKRYNRSLDKLKKTFENFRTAISLVDGAYKIVHNAQGQDPEVVLEGQGERYGADRPGADRYRFPSLLVLSSLTSQYR